MCNAFFLAVHFHLYSLTDKMDKKELYSVSYEIGIDLQIIFFDIIELLDTLLVEKGSKSLRPSKRLRSSKISMISFPSYIS